MSWRVIEHEGKRHRVAVVRTPQGVWVGWPGGSTLVAPTDRRRRKRHDEAEDSVRAPMTGRLVKLAVRPGDEVRKGDVVAILEAMKMEYRLTAPKDGTVTKVGAEEGTLVDLGAALVELAS